MEDAIRIGFVCAVVAQYKIDLIFLAHTAGNGRDGIVGCCAGMAENAVCRRVIATPTI